MSNFFSTETPIYQKVMKITMVIWMNVLWLISCLPILTIGASTAAYFRMLFNLREDKPVSFLEFYRAFGANFKQGTILWLLQLAAGFLLYLLAWCLFAVTSDVVRTVLVILFLGLLFAFTMVWIYGPALLCYFYNSLTGTITNALAMGLRHYHQTIPAILLTMLPIAFILLSPYWFLRGFPLFITFGTSGISYCIMLLLEKVFQNYTEIVT